MTAGVCPFLLVMVVVVVVVIIIVVVITDDLGRRREMNGWQRPRTSRATTAHISRLSE